MPTASQPRVLVVFGSETGNVRRGIHACVRKWQKSADGRYTLHSTNVMSGNDAITEFSSLDQIAHQFDVIVVATSSFGEGDPPSNFLKFLHMLVRAANTELKPGREKPLKGLQHCVLGYGQSVYATFQSCPRYTDKLLEELGSRRMVERVEIDEGPDETILPGQEDALEYITAMSSGTGEVDKEVTGRNVKLARFAVHVHSALLRASTTAEQPPVCAWTSPGAEVVEKTEEELVSVRPERVPDSEGAPQWLKYLAVAAVAAVTTHWLQPYLAQM